ncbi:MAG: hypothetical protein JWN70_6224 [Planctomycetaceae bacterium]|nr:hypothetical protein [Planctomycetaceae bacterium]
MTSGEKISLLKKIFQQGSNEGVLTWGPIKNGYRWNCDTHATAERLAEFLLSNVQLLRLDRASFPHRFDPEATLIIEPLNDQS